MLERTNSCTACKEQSKIDDQSSPKCDQMLGNIDNSPSILLASYANHSWYTSVLLDPKTSDLQCQGSSTGG